LNKTAVLVISGVLATAVAWIATGLVRRFAIRHAILDIPNDRSSHQSPVPRGGGLAIALVALVGMLLETVGDAWDLRLFMALVIGGTGIAGVGYADDLKSLSARVRLIVHVGASIAFLLVFVVFLNNRSIHLSTYTFWFGGGLLVFALLSSVNVFNFMDGIDGIAASEAVFVAGSGAWLNCFINGDSGVTLAFVFLASAAMGFLIWNMPPARIFMGDVGSGFLGFMLTALAIVASSTAAIPAQVWPILGGVFIADASVTLLRRYARGDRWFEAHKTHAYQHLAVRLQGHLPVTLLVSLINICWLFPWGLYALLVPERATISLIISLLPLTVLVSMAGAGKP
jgi:Fuc2NAc and GlcNAc transferase